MIAFFAKLWIADTTKNARDSTRQQFIRLTADVSAPPVR
jgi:hypothetical protein